MKKKRKRWIPYRELVGCLNYVATRTRPDIAFAVSTLCRFMANSGQQHWNAAKLVLRYLKGTSSFGIKYSDTSDIVGYADSNFAGDSDARRSTTGLMFLVSSGPVCWKSQMQKSTALPALEAEYMALCGAIRKVTWIYSILKELNLAESKPISIFDDNQGCQAISQNRRTDARTKHIDVRYHFTRDKIEDQTIELKRCETKNMMADFLTKPIDVQKFI
jgi:hypothetical protein